MQRLAEINRIIEKAIKETTNQKDIATLERLKPKRGFFDNLKKKDITEEEYNKILKAINNILYQELSTKYPYRRINDKSLSSKLTIALIQSYNIQYSIHVHDRKIKIYPIALDEKTAKEIYKNELQNIIQEHLTSNKTYEDIINERIKIYESRKESYRKTLNEGQIEPYYGTTDFMYEHASYINECIKKLPFKIESQDIILEEMKQFKDKYPKITDNYHERYPYFDKAYKRDYKNFEQNYLKLLEYEKSLMPYVKEIWQAYLTNPENHNNSSFKYIIHTFSQGLVPPEKMTKACCTLATEKLLTPPQGNCGLIYEFVPESIENICCKDAGSFTMTKEEFIEHFIEMPLPLTSQLTDSHILYEIPQISRLILPTELERYAIANNLVHNHELLNYTTFKAYTEIVLNSKARAIGVFYTDECKNIEEIKEYAKKYELPLVHLSLQQLRIQAGLNPIATKIEPNKEINETLHH